MPTPSNTAKSESFLDESEWNFCRECPEDELEECKIYECARQSSLWPLVFTELRQLGRITDFSARGPGWQRVFRLLSKFDQAFPAKPWLSIGEPDRKTGLSALRMPELVVLEEAPHPTFPTPRDDDEHTSESSLHWADGTDVLLAHSRPIGFEDSTFLSLLVSWKCTDEKLIARFAELLAKKRPDSHRVYSQRGKNKLRSDELRASLRQLGARNLLQAYRLNPSPWRTKKALLSSTNGRETYGYVRQLYGSVKALNSAAMAAEKEIHTLEPKELVFQSVENLKRKTGVRNHCTYRADIVDQQWVVFRRQ